MILFMELYIGIGFSLGILFLYEVKNDLDILERVLGLVIMTFIWVPFFCWIFFEGDDDKNEDKIE